MKKLFKYPLALILAAVLTLTSCTQQTADPSERVSEDLTLSESVSETTTKTSPAETAFEKPTEAPAESHTAAPETKTEALTSSETTEEPKKEPTEESAAETPAATEAPLTAEAETTATEAEMKKTDSAETFNTGTVKEITFTEETSVPSEIIVSTTAPAALKAFTARCDIPSLWEENGKYCGTCNFTVSNGTDSATEGWTVRITVPKGIEITSSWNGVFTLNGTSLTVTNESYNGAIEKNGAASFGFNFASPEKVSSFLSVATNGGAPVIGFNQGGNQTASTAAAAKTETSAPDNTPSDPLPAPVSSGLVKEHGRLSVKGARLVDKNGNNFQLKGMSTHGLSWFPDFVNENAFKTLRDDWNTNAVRLAMYTAEGNGYCTGGDKAALKELIDKGVKAASELGMYVIIDWHVLSDGNPQTNKAEALKFFDEISAKYKNYDNVLYEICNEPNGNVSWSGDIKPYAQEVIAVIRKNAPDSVVIVGTPTWSQDIDKAADDPLTENNVLYALHFYAATHTDWLRQRLTDCCNKGLPVFVSEFGTCDASGNGANDFGQAKQWLDLLDKYGISYINWNLANKNESSSAFKESASADGNWKESDLSEGGSWIRKRFRGE